jgi:phosphopantothenoylcysteine decarboxylase/phosphopantothenate--cysteine ligase
MSDSLSGKRFLVSAGPTREAIDPVRYISNFSSGKMGYAIAEELAARGAEVILVSGPVNVTTKHPSITLINVVSAADMYEACTKAFAQVNVAIMCAAVADYTIADPADKKIKKTGVGDDELTLHLIKTKDILAELGRRKKPGQVLGGFSLETHQEETFAKEKLHKKNCDFIVLNSLNDAGAGFAGDTNKISILTSDGGILHYPLKPKTEVAQDIVNFIGATYF